MSETNVRFILLFVLGVVTSSGTAYHVEINSSDHAVVGSTMYFNATLFDKNKPDDSDAFRFTWFDSVSPKKPRKVIETTVPYSNWTVEYLRNETRPGIYRATVEVEKKYWVWVTIATNHVDFELTDSLNGRISLLQNNVERQQDFVSITDIVNHSITLAPQDKQYLAEKSSFIRTYWFQNCTYLGVSDGYDYTSIYDKAEEYYDIEALVVATFEPLPEPTTTTTTTTTTPTTTTTKTTTTTPATTTTSTSSTSTTPRTTTTPKPKPAMNVTRSKRDINETMHANAALLGLNITAALQHQSANSSGLTAFVNPPLIRPVSGVRPMTHFVSKLSFANGDALPPFNCVNKSIIARDPKKAYGYFKHRIVSKAPIANFTTSGKNWLQHGEILNLEFKCKGSNPIQLCFLVFNAPYNSTGNETCLIYTTIEDCTYNYKRYFGESKTVLFFIKNDVSLSVNQVTINIYEAKTQSQLSVVVVPVSCCLVAVILVVFGVSYYLQSRNRFNVEVADFNFGETQSIDLEYKTFSQRLIESIREAMPRWRRHSQSNSDLLAEPVSPGGYSSGHVGEVDSNLRYNTLN